MCDVVQIARNFLAVSVFSGENQAYEAQRKASNHGRSRRETRSHNGQFSVTTLTGGAGKKVAQFFEDYRLHKKEEARQIFSASANFSGSSSSPSPRIATRNSCSVLDVSAIRKSSRCFLRSFKASASRGRRPRFFSSAMTSRISSSIVPFAIAETRNNTALALANQLYLFANLIWLTVVVSPSSAENQTHEERRNTSDYGRRSCQDCGTNGRDVVALFATRANRTPAQSHRVHFVRDGERALANPAMRLTGAKAALYTVNSRWVRNSARRASSHSACSAGAKLGSPPEFPKSANLPGRCRPSCGRKNNEQRQSHTTPPRHGHPA